MAGSSHRPNMSGGVHTSDVTLRKRSENRVYTEENIRDSIVMGELASKFPDFGTLSRFWAAFTRREDAFGFRMWCEDEAP